jgi:hypothetical protein
VSPYTATVITITTNDERLGSGPEQLLGVDIAGQDADGETGWQQYDERRDAQAAGEQLGAHREHDDQRDACQNLISGHARPSRMPSR